MRQLDLVRLKLARLRDDRSGAAAVVTSLVLVTTLGFVGLGADLGVAYAQRRSAQSAADSAAFSAAIGSAAGASNVSDQARSVAASYGFAHLADGVQVAVNQPATTGPQAGNARSVEVVVSKPMKRFFSGLFTSAASTIKARAVAVVGAPGNGCVIAFNPSAAHSALNNGTGTVELQNCSMYVNSTSSQGLTNNGSGSLSAQAINLVASTYLNNGTGSVTGALKVNQPAIADPYADVAMPEVAGCDFTGKIYTASQTIDPGPDGVMKFCDGVTFSGIAKSWVFLPGVYVIEDGNLAVNAINSSLSGNGVTFVLTSSNGSSYARLQLNGLGNTFTLTAPASGPTAGLLFFQDRDAPAGGQNVINGKANASLFTGALYFRKQQLTINGAGQSTGANCTQVLADSIVFNGASTFGVSCVGVGVRSVGGVATALVE